VTRPAAARAATALAGLPGRTARLPSVLAGVQPVPPVPAGVQSVPPGAQPG